MKYLALAVIVLLASSTLQQTPTPTPAPSCSTVEGPNQIALRWLRNSGVEILDQPLKVNGTMCQGDFNRVGTCCKPDKLVEFISKQNDIMVEKWKGYFTKLGRIRGKFLVGLTEVAKKINYKDLQQKVELLKSKGSTSGNFKNILADIPTSPNSTQAIKNSIMNFTANFNKFLSEAKGCFNMMKNTRANFYCAMCSYNANSYI